MESKIQAIIVQKGLTSKDCEYHTIRALENGGRIRAMVIKGDSKVHVEYRCQKCGHEDYYSEEYKHVSKASKIRFIVNCSKCGEKMPLEKLKAKKKAKKEE